jgi:hypothetical protein
MTTVIIFSLTITFIYINIKFKHFSQIISSFLYMEKLIKIRASLYLSSLKRMKAILKLFLFSFSFISIILEANLLFEIKTIKISF